MRGFTQGSENPAYMYDFLRKEIADVTEKYRSDFVKKYGAEPLGRKLFINYVKFIK